MKIENSAVVRTKVLDPLDGRTVVIVPARNEEKTIGQVVSEIRQFTKNVVVVDDQSEDSTASLGLQFGAKVIPTAGPVGYGNALRTGFEYAKSCGFSAIVTLDGDGAHDPADIRALHAAYLRSGSSVTIGDRFAEDRPTMIASSKRLANYFASHLFNLVLGISLRDVACGLRCIAATVADQLLKTSTSSGFGILVELLKLASMAPGSIGSAPVDVRYNAAELLSTSQRELLDVLGALSHELDPSAELAVLLTRLTTAVDKFEPVTVVLPELVLCVLPIYQTSGYLFQAQHISLRNQTIGAVLDFGKC